MVGSEDMAALIGHADKAGAKLVLIGDPQQLGAIEAGGLFSAFADRTEPILLNEVIRHNHELDREAAKRIREGEGRDALSLYRSAERVTVAPDAEQRREAMVGDWWPAFNAGEDVLMVAKTNREVEQLNAIAREVMQAEDRLGKEEIEVGEAKFAAGDQVITRVNHRAAEIYNRERWEVAEVDAEKRRVVLEGIDQARRVEVGTGRDETFLYATPEIQSGRSEYAPMPPERDAIGHVAEASERDRVQTAAHDEALRAELSRLSMAEIAERYAKLDTPSRFEAQKADAYARQRERVEERRRQYEQAVANREAAEGLGWRERRQALPRARESEGLFRDRLSENIEKLEGMEPPRSDLRREREIADQILTKRSEQALAAARIQTPSYIVKELGQRPTDPAKARAWDRGVEGIERYRQGFGVKERGSALGAEPKGTSQSLAREAVLRALREAQLRLGRERLAKSKERIRSIERGGFGISM